MSRNGVALCSEVNILSNQRLKTEAEKRSPQGSLSSLPISRTALDVQDKAMPFIADLKMRVRVISKQRHLRSTWPLAIPKHRGMRGSLLRALLPMRSARLI